MILMEVAEEYSKCYGCLARNYIRPDDAIPAAMIYKIQIAREEGGYSNALLVCPNCLEALRGVIGGPHV